MSSFKNPHRMYLFSLTNGKKKIAYGQNPKDALEIMSFRLSEEEMAQVIPDQWERISPRDIQKHVQEIG